MLGSLTLWMEVALWVVLGSMGLNLLVDLFKTVTGGKFSLDFVLGYLKDLLYYVMPLLLLAGISLMDVTGWVVLVGYYLGALAVLLKYLMDLKGKL
ncbi:hypothetical protein [Paenibacillus sp. ATY16]|uniref:hypothetical protein n=1 Tax=Paenibacillus sp. ATY16 TaxID=1759312 RepID=UPI00200CC88E